MFYQVNQTWKNPTVSSRALPGLSPYALERLRLKQLSLLSREVEVPTYLPFSYQGVNPSRGGSGTLEQTYRRSPDRLQSGLRARIERILERIQDLTNLDRTPFGIGGWDRTTA